MDQHLKQDALIEDALKSEPIAPLPRSITGDVMDRIRTKKRPAIITWSDFGLSFVIVSCLAALWFAWQNLPPILLAKLHIQGILLYQDFLVNSRWLVPALFFGSAAVLAALTIPTLLKMTMDHRR
jgi:hypothetical protein